MTASPATNHPPPASVAPEVFYDGACPLCAREIAFYQNLKGGTGIRWTDVSTTRPADLPPGLSPEAARARFHVRGPGGEVFDGAATFASLWTHLPGFRLLGRIAEFPPVLWALEHLYNAFLKLRPALQRWVIQGSTRTRTTDKTDHR
jgi:ubiquinone biosynthesis monooxygenase Coq7